jgi:hypothetical protein
MVNPSGKRCRFIRSPSECIVFQKHSPTRAGRTPGQAASNPRRWGWSRWERSCDGGWAGDGLRYRASPGSRPQDDRRVRAAGAGSRGRAWGPPPTRPSSRPSLVWADTRAGPRPRRDPEQSSRSLSPITRRSVADWAKPGCGSRGSTCVSGPRPMATPEKFLIRWGCAAERWTWWLAAAPLSPFRVSAQTTRVGRRGCRDGTRGHVAEEQGRSSTG